LTLSRFLKSLDHHWTRPDPQLITLNSIFSGRKTARLIHLASNLQRSGIDTAVQVECSRFVARQHPALAASMIIALVREMDARS